MAVISLMGTLAGSGGSIYAANRLISYRLNRLEEIVRERESAVRRIYDLEKDNAIIHQKIREISDKLDIKHR